MRRVLWSTPGVAVAGAQVGTLSTETHVRVDLLLRRAATAVTIGCVTVVVGSALVMAVPALRDRWGQSPPGNAGYRVGDPIDLPATIHESSPLTLLLFTRAGCGACQAAKPAFASLVGGLRDRASIRTLMIVRQGSEPEEREYLRAIGLDEDRLVGVDFRNLRLRRVPTIVLVDRRGEVQYALEGAPTALNQEELLQIAASVNVVR